MVHDGDRQGRPFVRVGPGADFVEQHEGRGGEPCGRFRDVAHVGRKGREVGGDRLVVADVGENLPEHGQPGGARRDVEPHLRHQRKQPRGLERDRFPPGVRAADHQHVVLPVQFERNGDRGPPRAAQGVLEHRVPRIDQFAGPVFRDPRRDALELLGEEGSRLGDIQLGDQLEKGAQGIGAAPEDVGQGAEDTGDFDPLLLPEADEVVVLVDDGHRFHEGCLPAGGEPVHDAGDPGARIGPDRDDEAAVAEGDDVLLDRLRRGAQDRFEGALDAVPAFGDLPADGPKPGAGAVVDVAAGQDLAVDLFEQRAGVRDPGRHAPQDGEEARGRGGADRIPEPLAGGEEPLERENLPRFERRPFDVEPLHHRVEVLDPRQAEPAARGEKPYALAGEVERRGDFGRVGGRAQALQPLAAGGRLHVPGGQGDQRPEFECVQCPFVHATPAVPSILRSGAFFQKRDFAPSARDIKVARRRVFR